MHLELQPNADPKAPQSGLCLGGGEQAIEIHALGLQGETRKNIRLFLQLTDRRTYKSPPGVYQQISSERIIEPLALWRVKEVLAEFRIALADSIRQESEFYLLEETGFRNGQPRDTILKFLGRDPSRDAKVSLSGFGENSDVVLFVTAHPLVPINRLSRMNDIQGDDPRYSNARRKYQAWVTSNDTGHVGS